MGGLVVEDSLLRSLRDLLFTVAVVVNKNGEMSVMILPYQGGHIVGLPLPDCIRDFHS